MITLDHIKDVSKRFYSEKEKLNKLIENVKDEELRNAIEEQLDETLADFCDVSYVRLNYEAQYQIFSGSVESYKKRLSHHIKVKFEDLA